jgi:hypothetical protein
MLMRCVSTHVGFNWNQSHNLLTIWDWSSHGDEAVDVGLRLGVSQCVSRNVGICLQSTRLHNPEDNIDSLTPNTKVNMQIFVDLQMNLFVQWFLTPGSRPKIESSCSFEWVAKYLSEIWILVKILFWHGREGRKVALEMTRVRTEAEMRVLSLTILQPCGPICWRSM